jgi:hypothetical protein
VLIDARRALAVGTSAVTAAFAERGKRGDVSACLFAIFWFTLLISIILFPRLLHSKITI